MRPYLQELQVMIKKRILIVDNHPITREGFRNLFATDKELEVCGEASDGLEAVDLAESLQPDLILMDFSMPRMNGLEATIKIKKKKPETKILVFTVHNSPEYVSATLMAGADGYVSKEITNLELLQSIRDIFSGKQVVNLKF